MEHQTGNREKELKIAKLELVIAKVQSEIGYFELEMFPCAASICLLRSGFFVERHFFITDMTSVMPARRL